MWGFRSCEKGYFLHAVLTLVQLQASLDVGKMSSTVTPLENLSSPRRLNSVSNSEASAAVMP